MTNISNNFTEQIKKIVSILILLSITSCGVVKPYISTPAGEPRAKIILAKGSEYLELQVYMFEPDENCKFHSRGTTFVEKKDGPKVIYVSPGRRYFRVFGRYTAPGWSSSTDLFDRSFTVENNKEYKIYFEQLPTKRYRRFAYDISFTDVTGTEPKILNTQDFSICKELL